MSTTATRHESITSDPSTAPVDMKLEVVTLPVSDVERATEFYRRLGWRQDVTPPNSGILQFTPPASACSVQFGPNRTNAVPGSAQNQFLVVADLQVACDDLVRRGIKVSETYHVGADGRTGPGIDPAHGSYGSYASFDDPDGNRWLMQEVTTRLPGRIDSGVTSFGSVSDLASALRRVAGAHDKHEKRTSGDHSKTWPDWYARYLAAEQNGEPLPT